MQTDCNFCDFVQLLVGLFYVPEFSFGLLMLGLHQRNHKTACINKHIVANKSSEIFLNSSGCSVLLSLLIMMIALNSIYRILPNPYVPSCFLHPLNTASIIKKYDRIKIDGVARLVPNPSSPNTTKKYTHTIR